MIVAVGRLSLRCKSSSDCVAVHRYVMSTTCQLASHVYNAAFTASERLIKRSTAIESDAVVVNGDLYFLSVGPTLELIAAPYRACIRSRSCRIASVRLRPLYCRPVLPRRLLARPGPPIAGIARP